MFGEKFKKETSSEKIKPKTSEKAEGMKETEE